MATARIRLRRSLVARRVPRHWPMPRAFRHFPGPTRPALDRKRQHPVNSRQRRWSASTVTVWARAPTIRPSAHLLLRRTLPTVNASRGASLALACNSAGTPNRSRAPAHDLRAYTRGNPQRHHGPADTQAQQARRSRGRHAPSDFAGHARDARPAARGDADRVRSRSCARAGRRRRNRRCRTAAAFTAGREGHRRRGAQAAAVGRRADTGFRATPAA